MRRTMFSATSTTWQRKILRVMTNWIDFLGISTFSLLNCSLLGPLSNLLHLGCFPIIQKRKSSLQEPNQSMGSIDNADTIESAGCCSKNTAFPTPSSKMLQNPKCISKIRWDCPRKRWNKVVKVPNNRPYAGIWKRGTLWACSIVFYDSKSTQSDELFLDTSRFENDARFSGGLKYGARVVVQRCVGTKWNHQWRFVSFRRFVHEIFWFLWSETAPGSNDILCAKKGLGWLQDHFIRRLFKYFPQ